MIILDEKCKGLESILRRALLQSNEKHSVMDTIFGDFDGCDIEFSKQDTQYTVKLMWKACEFFFQHGSKEIIEKAFEGYSVEFVDQGVAIGFNSEQLPADEKGKEEFIDKLSKIKYYVFSGPFRQIMNASPEEVKQLPPLQLEVRPGEYVWIIPKEDGSFQCGFSHTVADKTDLPIARVVYAEFNGVRSNAQLNACPGAVSSEKIPADLSSFEFRDAGINGYIIFTFQTRHFKTDALKEKAIAQLMMFRPYLAYHFKCTKAFTHYRMRSFHTELVQVLNRAKPVLAKPKELRTISGKTDAQIQFSLTQLQSDDGQTVLNALVSLQKITSQESFNRYEAIVTPGILDLFFRILQYDNRTQFLETTTWILINISCAPQDFYPVFEQSQIVPALVKTVTSTEEVVIAQSLWALGNFLLFNENLRDQAMKSGILQALDPLLSQPVEQNQINFNLIILLYVLRVKIRDSEDKVKTMLSAAFLVESISLLDSSSTRYALSSLGTICEDPSARILLYQRPQTITRVFQITNSLNFQDAVSALHVLNTLSMGDDIQLESMMTTKNLKYLDVTLTSQNVAVVRDCILIIGNLAMGSDVRIDAIIRSTLVQSMLSVWRGSSIELRPAIAGVFTMLVYGKQQHIRALLDYPLMEILSPTLTSSEFPLARQLEAIHRCLSVAKHSSKMVAVDHQVEGGWMQPEAEVPIIQKLLTDLEQTGGKDQIEQLQGHPDKRVQMLARMIVEGFFGGNEVFAQFLERNTQQALGTGGFLSLSQTGPSSGGGQPVTQPSPAGTLFGGGNPFSVMPQPGNPLHTQGGVKYGQ
ncbi:putative arp2/3 complex 34 kDa subunit [Blattamonas nauphoetae]|uniref:Arp2/3 complex 34 kDa subunit n=1 Tax=Blattamonas nauphoetae TaxID=2049346 RepID=A0ABQ9YEL8_9EUKA|nr:putative arp2/3 complex 34 kDa subunit [Blattamonas nauphoetae]